MSRRLSALPLACFLVIVAYACSAAAVIGHWPSYNNPDPKQLPLRPLLYATDLACLTGVLSVMVLPLAYGIARAVATRRKQLFALRPGTLPLYFSGAALWVVDIISIRTRGPWPSLLDWFLD
jgi:hypothetical protein